MDEKTVTIPAEYTFIHGRTGLPYKIDLTDWVESALKYFMQYGLTKGFNDKQSQCKPEWFADGKLDPKSKLFGTTLDYKDWLTQDMDNRVKLAPSGMTSSSRSGFIRVDAVVKELRLVVAAQFQKRQIRATTKFNTITALDCKPIVAFAEQVAKKVFVTKGRKFAKENVKYGGQKVLEGWIAKAQENVARMDVDFDYDDNDWA